VLYFIDEYNKYNKKMDLNEIEALFQISDNNYMTSLNLRPFIEFNRDLPTMKQWIQLYKKYNISGRDGFYTVARYDYSAEDMEYVFKNGVFSSEIQSGEAFNIMNEYAYYLSAADLMKKVKSGIKIDKNLEKDYQELKQKEIEKLNKMESAT
jgi:hypothetical protein